ncbi:MAG: orotidine-5'-phosphate decarboxylase [Gammaproteobacteria bacterium]|jgi:orotidine-5'-phosphate decarboxylase
MRQSPATDPRVIVALDFADTAQALALVARLRPELCRVKIGKELFTRGGPALVEQVAARGFAVFLDLKFHDIPNTVAQACKAAADLGVWMLNVHALGGRRMMEAASEAVAAAAARPLLIGVTLLTSLEQRDLREIGIDAGVEEQVVRLASLAQQSGLDGVVCSAREARSLRARFGPDFRLVTPGIRPGGAAAQDQSRTMSPAEALDAGADYLVIGRPITQVPDPVAALEAIRAEIAAAATG